MLLLTKRQMRCILNPVIEQYIKVLLRPRQAQERIGNPVRFRNGTATVSAEAMHRRKPVIGENPEKACTGLRCVSQETCFYGFRMIQLPGWRWSVLFVRRNTAAVAFATAVFYLR